MISYVSAVILSQYLLHLFPGGLCTGVLLHLAYLGEWVGVLVIFA